MSTAILTIPTPESCAVCPRPIKMWCAGHNKSLLAGEYQTTRHPNCPLRVKEDLDFGDYVSIEMKRYCCGNEIYTHKVIGISESNTWVDVPVQEPATETIHTTLEPVVSCISCGVMETDVRKYRIKDVKAGTK